MPNASVTFDRVSKRFGSTTAVNELDLHIEPGSFVVLVGPSGCGKTTALRMIAGLEEPSDGRLLIGTDDVTWTRPRNRDVAMVFQSYALYPHLTVRENLAFPLRQRKVGRAEIDERVLAAAEMLELGGLLDRLPKQLSGGQRQRVAVGRAVVRSPRVFLMDEPLSNLDAQLRVRARAELTALHRRLGTTVVYVTHDQIEAMTMGDVVVVLRDGELQQQGTPREVYDTPANTFVAGFVGSPAMSLVEGTVGRDGPAPVFQARGMQLTLPPELAQRLDRRDRVILGLRAEHLGAEAMDEGADHIEGEVVLVEPLGSDVLATVLVGTNRLTARLAADSRVKVGDATRLAPDLRRVHLFDAVDGMRLC